MRVVVVGLGIQGRKRLAIAGEEAVATVDPVQQDAAYQNIESVPIDSFDAACVCTSDEAKLELLTYLLRHGKHILVEKPLLGDDVEDLAELGRLAQASGAVCYTAYNHRFEPHLVGLKRVLDSGEIGEVYHARFFYGNGTARDVRSSPWRDQGLGVIPDLASHMLDLCLFYFGSQLGRPRVLGQHRFENAACDHFLIGFDGTPTIVMEGTLLSWRNTFTADLLGSKGSAHVQGLCKWGPSRLVVRQRVLPSGKPPERCETLEQADPTWVAEYDHFKSLCQDGGTNIENDSWISDVIRQIGTAGRAQSV
jgi:scyllo-inositol 2-dehydrogenase (NADP+)